jgi:hypothetical protein
MPIRVKAHILPIRSDGIKSEHEVAIHKSLQLSCHIHKVAMKKVHQCAAEERCFGMPRYVHCGHVSAHLSAELRLSIEEDRQEWWKEHGGREEE